MANNFISQVEIEERIQCLICHGRLEHPKQLSCTHSFCLGCLRRSFRGNKISCPSCKFVTNIPQSGVEALQDDHFSNALIELVSPSRQRPASPGFYPSITCKSHRKNLDIYCITCEEPVCYECLRHHGDHLYEALTDVSTHRRRDLRNMCVRLEEATHTINGNILQLQHLKSRLGQDLDTTKAEINERAQRQIQLIEKQRGTVINDLERQTNNQLQRVQQIHQGWQDAVKTIQNCESYTSQLIEDSNDVGFLKHEREAKERLLRLRSVPLPVYQIQPRRYVHFTSNEEFLRNSTIEDLGHCRDCQSVIFPRKYREKLTFPSSSTNLKPSLRNPYDVALCLNNDIIVSDNGNQTLQLFDKFGAYIKNVTPNITGFDPKGIAITRQNKLIISDCRNNRVVIIDSNGKLEKTIGDIVEPIGIAISKDGSIYVVSYGSHCVKIYSFQGKFRLTFGGNGNGHGKFNHPMFIAINSKDQLIISDNYNNRVQILDSQGFYQFSICQWGENEPLTYPRGVAIDSQNNIYVSSERGIHVYSEDGLYINQVSSKHPGIRHNYFGVTVAKRDPPKVIAVDHHNKFITIYECEEEDAVRIQVIQACNPGNIFPRRHRQIFIEDKENRTHAKSGVCIIL
uniref:Tripartite motif-containing protein 2-like n=1 Tax=Saccoglossus kowalevskii TaxID=10224 RepID=A0ABM0M1H3_SACKO|nr:PREDICTED: tripartite motif-containing protein 2-like [Saccoglossus kowalevskii]